MLERFARTIIYCNAQMSSRRIKKHCRIDEASRNLLESAIDKLGLSAFLDWKQHKVPKLILTDLWMGTN
jgi:magnesium chelatase family protein